MKTCSRCHSEKPRSEFYRDRRRIDGLYSHCKQCAREVAAAWRKANIERVRENGRKYARKRYREDPERFNVYSRRYYATHKEQHRKLTLAWQRANPEKVRGYAQKYRRKRQLEQFLAGEANLSLRTMREFATEIPNLKQRETVFWFLEHLKGLRDEARRERRRAASRDYYARNKEQERKYHREYMRAYRARRKEASV